MEEAKESPAVKFVGIIRPNLELSPRRPWRASSSSTAAVASRKVRASIHGQRSTRWELPAAPAMVGPFVSHGGGACKAGVEEEPGRREAVWKEEACRSACTCTWEPAVGEAKRKKRNRAGFLGGDHGR